MLASLNALREIYSERRRTLLEEFWRATDVNLLLSGLTEAADELVRQLVEIRECHEHLCLIAIGGYGRRELYPCSDIDLLLIYSDAHRERAEKSATEVLHDLWDSKLLLGHQVWSVEALRELTLRDVEFVLALMDGRIVAGDAKLGREVLEDILPSFIRTHSRALIENIVDITEKRHASFRNTIYQLEPDVKESPGGLRDYLVGRWLCALSSSETTGPAISKTDVENAWGVLARLRIMLHLLRGREQNQLTHRMQEEIARKRGYSEDSLRDGVESLMMEYFLHARILHSVCLRAIRDAKGESNRAEDLDFHPDTTLNSVSDLLDVFLRSLDEKRGLSDRARARIAEALPIVSPTVSFPDLASRVKKLFKPRPGLYRTLTEMYEVGLLELLFPEFGSIKARVVRDFYHKYTVDEHSLLTIRNIEKLLTTKEHSDLRFRSLLLESSDSELLNIALLLHDIGKRSEGAHVNRGTAMAAKALRRFRLSTDDFETVLFLIRNHLAMSAVIFRRDLEDPQVISRFADLVNDPARLRLLTLMTYADIKAVAPGTLTDWKKDLLWQLYVSTYIKLTLGFGAQRIEEEDVGEKLLNHLPGDLDPGAFERFLEGFPRRYLSTVPPAEIYEHFRLATQLSPENPVQLRLIDRDGYYELCAVTPDRYYLFAKIVGLLSYFEMNILRGYGFSNRQSTVLDLFQFHDTREVFRINPGEKTRFLELLKQAIADEISVEKVLAGKEQSIIFRPVGPCFPPTVRFEEEFSRDYSILEIIAPDSIGLLYRIGREISGLRCNIELVLISTEGNKAVDVFYLSYQGKKLPAELRQQLKEAIIAAIG